MKIGINIKAGTALNTGKGQYTYRLTRELLSLDRKNQYLLYTNVLTKEFVDFANAEIKVIHKKPFGWHYAVLSDWKKTAGPGDLFFDPASYIISALLPSGFRSIITVHDLVSFLHPRLHHTKSTILEHIFLRRALRKTAHVLVPSENTKKDLIRLLKYPEKKITVTPLAPCHGEFIESMTRLKNKYCLPPEFILTVSGLEPRKNIGTLMDVLLELIKKYPDLKLVIVGGKGWKSKENEKKIERAKEHILWIKNVDSEDLPGLYGLAKVFVFPSIYEGFGLPPLEAMASGCPVICSRAASLPEVAGDAALLFDPHDKKMLTAHIENVLKNTDLRKKLVEGGKHQAAKFSWKKTAEKTLKAFDIMQ